MNKTSRRVKMVLAFIVVLFMAMVLYLAYFQIVLSEKIVRNPYNARLKLDQTKYKRGNILDRDGNILAETKIDQEGNAKREYPFNELYAHIVGYTSQEFGNTGIEDTYNDYLLNLNNQTPIEDIKNMVKENLEGNNVRLTLNTELQKYASEKLEGHKGAIVVMNPSTGEILSMVSNPTFNPNTISENWSNLINDKDSPLLNRASQGQYTPGSVIKVITAAGVLQARDRIDIRYNDEGSVVVDGYTINNFENLAHGNIDTEMALVYSSNTYFASKGVELGGLNMAVIFNNFMFNQDVKFDIDINKSSSYFEDGMSQTELAAASFGQGKTIVSPLHMAMVSSAIANNGKMVQPYIVSKVINSEGEVLKDTKTKVLIESTSEEVAKLLRKYMGTVVENYETAKTDLIASGGKTGTAETASGKTHAWYIGFAPLDNPKYSVSVILEEDGTLGGKTAAPIGAAMLDKAYELMK